MATFPSILGENEIPPDLVPIDEEPETPEPPQEDFGTTFGKLQSDFRKKFGRDFYVSTPPGDPGYKDLHKKLHPGGAADISAAAHRGGMTDEEANFIASQGKSYGLNVHDYRKNWKEIGGSAPHIHIDRDFTTHTAKQPGIPNDLVPIEETQGSILPDEEVPKDLVPVEPAQKPTAPVKSAQPTGSQGAVKSKTPPPPNLPALKARQKTFQANDTQLSSDMDALNAQVEELRQMQYGVQAGSVDPAEYQRKLQDYNYARAELTDRLAAHQAEHINLKSDVDAYNASLKNRPPRQISPKTQPVPSQKQPLNEALQAIGEFEAIKEQAAQEKAQQQGMLDNRWYKTLQQAQKKAQEIQAKYGQIVEVGNLTDWPYVKPKGWSYKKYENQPSEFARGLAQQPQQPPLTPENVQDRFIGLEPSQVDERARRMPTFLPTEEARVKASRQYWVDQYKQQQAAIGAAQDANHGEFVNALRHGANSLLAPLTSTVYSVYGEAAKPLAAVMDYIRPGTSDELQHRIKEVQAQMNDVSLRNNPDNWFNQFLGMAGGMAPKLATPGGIWGFAAAEALDAKAHGAPTGEVIRAGLTAALTARLAHTFGVAAMMTPTVSKSFTALSKLENFGKLWIANSAAPAFVHLITTGETPDAKQLAFDTAFGLLFTAYGARVQQLDPMKPLSEFEPVLGEMANFLVRAGRMTPEAAREYVNTAYANAVINTQKAGLDPNKVAKNIRKAADDYWQNKLDWVRRYNAAAPKELATAPQVELESAVREAVRVARLAGVDVTPEFIASRYGIDIDRADEIVRGTDAEVQQANQQRQQTAATENINKKLRDALYTDQEIAAMTPEQKADAAARFEDLYPEAAQPKPAEAPPEPVAPKKAEEIDDLPGIAYRKGKPGEPEEGEPLEVYKRVGPEGLQVRSPRTGKTYTINKNQVFVPESVTAEGKGDVVLDKKTKQPLIVLGTRNKNYLIVKLPSGKITSLHKNATLPATPEQAVAAQTPVPEATKTLETQIKALDQGRRSAVLVTPGSSVPESAKGYEATTTPVGTFIHPHTIDAQDIQDLVDNGQYYRLLGYVAPKPKENEPAVTVVARDKQGNEIQTAVVPPEFADLQDYEFRRMYPDANVTMGGQVLSRQVVQQRVAEKQKEEPIETGLEEKPVEAPVEAQVSTKPPDEISATIYGRPSRVTATIDKLADGTWRVNKIKIHDDATGKYYLYSIPDGTFPSQDAARQAAFDYVRNTSRPKPEEAAPAKPETKEALTNPGRDIYERLDDVDKQGIDPNDPLVGMRAIGGFDDAHRQSETNEGIIVGKYAPTGYDRYNSRLGTEGYVIAITENGDPGEHPHLVVLKDFTVESPAESLRSKKPPKPTEVVKETPEQITNRLKEDLTKKYGENPEVAQIMNDVSPIYSEMTRGGLTPEQKREAFHELGVAFENVQQMVGAVRYMQVEQGRAPLISLSYGAGTGLAYRVLGRTEDNQKILIAGPDYKFTVSHSPYSLNGNRLIKVPPSREDIEKAPILTWHELGFSSDPFPSIPVIKQTALAMGKDPAWVEREITKRFNIYNTGQTEFTDEELQEHFPGVWERMQQIQKEAESFGAEMMRAVGSDDVGDEPERVMKARQEIQRMLYSPEANYSPSELLYNTAITSGYDFIQYMPDKDSWMEVMQQAFPGNKDEFFDNIWRAVNDSGEVLPAVNTIVALPERAAAAEMRTALNQLGVKDADIQSSGLGNLLKENALAEKEVTKQEVSPYLDKIFEHAIEKTPVNRALEAAYQQGARRRRDPGLSALDDIAKGISERGAGAHVSPRMLQVWAREAYNGNVPTVTVKESLQNAIDSVAAKFPETEAGGHAALEREREEIYKDLLYVLRELKPTEQEKERIRRELKAGEEYLYAASNTVLGDRLWDKARFKEVDLVIKLIDKYYKVQPESTKGEVNISVDTETRTIKIDDNGIGMPPAVALKEFLDPGESYKPTAEGGEDTDEGQRGGYGFAKVAILGNAQTLKVHTVALDPETGRKMATDIYNRAGNPDSAALQWLNLELDHTSYEVPEQTPTGTSIEVSVMEDPNNSQLEFLQNEIKEFVQRTIAYSTIPYRISLDINNVDKLTSDDVDYKPTWQFMKTLEVPGAKIDLYQVDYMSQYAADVYYLNNGLFQFRGQQRVQREGKVPDKILVDVRATAKPGTGDYPWEPNREALRRDAKEKVIKFLEELAEEAAKAAAEREREAYRKAIREAPVITGAPEPSNRLKAAGKEVAELIYGKDPKGYYHYFAYDKTGNHLAEIHYQDIAGIAERVGGAIATKILKRQGRLLNPDIAEQYGFAGKARLLSGPDLELGEPGQRRLNVQGQDVYKLSWGVDDHSYWYIALFDKDDEIINVPVSEDSPGLDSIPDENVKEYLTDLFGKHIADKVLNLEGRRYTDDELEESGFEEAGDITGDDLLLPKAKMAAFLPEHAVVDTSQKIPKETVDSILNAKYALPLSQHVLELFTRLQEDMSKRNPEFSYLRLLGLGLGDDYLGVNVRHDLAFGDAGPDIVLFNPYNILGEALERYPKDREQAETWFTNKLFNTLIHEIVHRTDRKHGSNDYDVGHQGHTERYITDFDPVKQEYLTALNNAIATGEISIDDLKIHMQEVKRAYIGTKGKDLFARIGIQSPAEGKGPAGAERPVTEGEERRPGLGEAVSRRGEVQHLERPGTAVGERGPSELELKAYHGSPYHFDKFTLEHIGEGEGAHAYGWGLYFADKKEVAKYYRDALSQSRIDLSKLDDLKPESELQRVYIDAVKSTGDYIAARDTAYYSLTKDKGREHKQLWGRIKDYAEEVYKQIRVVGGKVYHVDLAPKEDEYLLWDKPLSEQSEKVREALKDDPDFKALSQAPDKKTTEEWGDIALQPFTGQYLYTGIAQRLGYDQTGLLKKLTNAARMRFAPTDDEAASKYLLSKGIKGIKYENGQTRGKDIEKQYNYVIFDDADVAIAEIERRKPKILSKEPTPNELSRNRVEQLRFYGYTPVVRRQARTRKEIETWREYHGDSIFFSPRGDDVAEYGDYKLNYVIAPTAKIFHYGSSEELAADRGWLDRPEELVKKFTKYTRGELSTLRDVINARDEGDETGFFQSLQGVAARELKAEGYDGAHWGYEDDLSPEQYQIWNQNVLSRPGEALAKLPPSSVADLFNSTLEENLPEALEMKKQAQDSLGKRMSDAAISRASRSARTVYTLGREMGDAIIDYRPNHNRLYINDTAEAVLRIIRTEAEAAKPPLRRQTDDEVASVYGVTMDISRLYDLVEAANKLWSQTGNPIAKQILGDFIDKFSLSLERGEPLVIAEINGEMATHAIVKHEEFHRVGMMLKHAFEGLLPDIERVRTLPHIRMLITRIGGGMGYKTDVRTIAEEAAARIATEDNAELEMTEEEELDFITGYFDMMADTYGEDALDNYKLLTDKIREVKNAVQKRFKAARDYGKGLDAASALAQGLQRRWARGGKEGTSEAEIKRQFENTPAFKRFFNGSKVVDEQGNPLIVYHGTPAGFDIFEKGDIGFHFGTIEQANNRLADKRIFWQQEGGQLMPVYLSIKNPLRMPDAGAHSSAGDLLDAVRGTNALTVSELHKLEDEAERIFNTASSGKEWEEANRKAVEWVRDKLIEKGYDGIVYENKQEGTGDSWIAFKREQVKSAIGNKGTFGLEYPSILERRRAVEDTPAFKRFFEGSVITDEEGNPQIMYHGTPVGGDIDEFRENRGGYIYITNNPLYASNFGALWNPNARSAVYPVYASVKKPFDIQSLGPDVITGRKVLTFLRKKGINIFGIELRRFGRALNDTDWAWAWVQAPGVKEALAAKGYDAIKQFEDEKGTITAFAIFDRKQLKSATGNRGTFNPEAPSILERKVNESRDKLTEAIREGLLGRNPVEDTYNTTLVTGYDLYHPGMSNDDWNEAVITELGKRALPHLDATWDLISGKQPVFFSPLENVFRLAKGDKFGINEIRGLLKNLPMDEVKFSEIENLLKEKKSLTKKEILDFLALNNVQVVPIIREQIPEHAPFEWVFTEDESGMKGPDHPYIEALDALGNSYSINVSHPAPKEEAETPVSRIRVRDPWKPYELYIRSASGALLSKHYAESPEAAQGLAESLRFDREDPNAVIKRVEELFRGEGWGIEYMDDEPWAVAFWKIGKNGEMQGDVHGPDELPPYLQEDGHRIEIAYRQLKTGGGTKYATYITKGGNNYVEILMVLPPRRGLYAIRRRDAFQWEVYNTETGENPTGGLYDNKDDAEAEMDSRNRVGLTTEQEQRVAQLYAQGKTDTPEYRALTGIQDAIYRSAHWDETNNSVAHIRGDMRKHTDGVKTFAVDETQSDWAHDFKEKNAALEKEIALLEKGELPEGYHFTNEPLANGKDNWILHGRNNEFLAQDSSKEAAIASRIELLKEDRIPDMPFMKQWPLLTVKQAIRYAAQKGVPRVSFMPARVHIKRWGTEQATWNKIPVGALAGRVSSARLAYKQAEANLEKFDEEYNIDDIVDSMTRSSADTRGRYSFFASHDLNVEWNKLKSARHEAGESYKQALKEYEDATKDMASKWTIADAGTSPDVMYVVRDAQGKWLKEFYIAQYGSKEEMRAAAQDYINDHLHDERVWLLNFKPQSGGVAGEINLEQEALARGLLEGAKTTVIANKEHLQREIRKAIRYGETDSLVDKIWKEMNRRDAGVSWPRAEGLLARYGDTAGYIKDKFPGRDDLLKFAWDREGGKSEAFIPMAVRDAAKSFNAGVGIRRVIIGGPVIEGEETIADGFKTVKEAQKWMEDNKVDGIPLKNLTPSGRIKSWRVVSPYPSFPSMALDIPPAMSDAAIRIGQPLYGTKGLNEPVYISEARLRQGGKRDAINQGIITGREILLKENDFNKWSSEMVEQLGNSVKPYLFELWTRLQAAKEFDEAPKELERRKERPAEKTEAFKKWFEDSKVVDKKGKPIVVYHGHHLDNATFTEFNTPAFFTEDEEDADFYATRAGEEGTLFDVYLSIKNPLRIKDEKSALILIDAAKRAGVTVEYEPSTEDRGWSFYSPDIAKHYSGGEGGNELDLLFVPGVIDELKNLGYDGVFAYDTLFNRETPTWVAFNRSQIKSASKNVGTFSPESPSILERKKPSDKDKKDLSALFDQLVPKGREPKPEEKKRESKLGPYKKELTQIDGWIYGYEVEMERLRKEARAKGLKGDDVKNAVPKTMVDIYIQLKAERERIKNLNDLAVGGRPISSSEPPPGETDIDGLFVSRNRVPVEEVEDAVRARWDEMSDDSGLDEGDVASAYYEKKKEYTPFWRAFDSNLKANTLAGLSPFTHKLGALFGHVITDVLSDIPAAMMARLIAKAKKTAPAYIFDPKGLAEATKQVITETPFEVWQILRHGATKEQMQRLLLPNEINTRWWWMNFMPKFVFRGFKAGAHIYGAWFAERSNQRQSRLVAMNEVASGLLKPEDTEKRAEEIRQGKNVSDGLAAVIDGNNLLAYTYGVMQGENFITNIRKNIIGWFPGEGWKFAVNRVVPFIRSASNAYLTSTDFLGVGPNGLIAKIIEGSGRKREGREFFENDTHVREFSKAFGQLTIGMGLFLLGVVLHRLGYMSSLYYSSDENPQPGELRFPKLKFAADVARYSPLGLIAAIGATFDELTHEKGINVFQGFASSVLKGMFELPLFQQTENLVDWAKNFVRGKAGLSGGFGTAFAPVIPFWGTIKDIYKVNQADSEKSYLQRVLHYRHDEGIKYEPIAKGKSARFPEGKTRLAEASARQTLERAREIYFDDSQAPEDKSRVKLLKDLTERLRHEGQLPTVKKMFEEGLAKGMLAPGDIPKIISRSEHSQVGYNAINAPFETVLDWYLLDISPPLEHQELAAILGERLMSWREQLQRDADQNKVRIPKYVMQRIEDKIKQAREMGAKDEAKRWLEAHPPLKKAG